MAVNLNDLIKKRGVIKRRQTLFKKYVDGIQDLITTSQIIDNCTILDLEGRLEKEQILLSEFEQVQNEIEILHDNLDDQLNEREIFETAHFSSIALCKTIISDYYKHQKSLQYNGNVSEEGLANSDGSVAPQQNIKLPQIQLPKFFGSYENWLEFRDTFNSLINENSAINNIQKFHYLRASLEGGAAQVIRSLEFSANNYTVAWETLLKRYNNDNLLIHNHIKSIFDIPVLMHESANELRKINDILAKHLRSLKMLNQPVEHWDTILIYIITEKLDKTTSRYWEEHKAMVSGNKNKMLNLEEFQAFLKQRADLLETLVSSKQLKISNQKKGTYHLTNTNISCGVCQQPHHIQVCDKFLRMPVNQRIDQVRNLKLCINCLRRNHSVNTCYSGGCRKCKRKHNTLLHFERQTKVSQSENENENEGENLTNPVQTNFTTNSESTIQSVTLSNHEKTSGVVFLSTALVQIKDSFGEYNTCRVLLDTASQSNLITSDLAERLGLRKTSVNISLVGINQVTSNIKYKCNVHIESLHNAFQITVPCLIVNKISESIPNRHIDISTLNIPKHLKLADHDCGVPNKIDILLGASLFYNLLCIGQVRLGNNLPTLQKTLLGWVISGMVPSNAISRTTQCHLNVNLDIQEQLTKFWEIEETSSKISPLSKDEEMCEEIFIKTTRRDPFGRFIVQIPFKRSPSLLGDSKASSLQRFYSMEMRLAKKPNLKQLYHDFMKEYAALGHMSKVINPEIPLDTFYYFPHHGVLNEANQTTKLRVVFDGSARTDSGISINDLQLIGPRIQDDIVSIVLRFRTHNIVICADIVKMYRQIQIDPSQKSLQRIWWRFNPQDTLSTYELQTVTYGTASAPWLAVRCLKQVALDFKNSLPRSSNLILQDFYMDDLLTGVETELEAIQVCDEITKVLKSGCFELQKWASNSKSVLEHVKSLNPTTILKIGDNQKTKILGLYWCCSEDTLMYNIGSYIPSEMVTKRSVLSDIAQIYDPLGLVAPCIIVAKIILQKLWMFKLSWDEGLPIDLDTKWKNFRRELESLNAIQIPRHVLNKNAIKYELHGFSDASMEAYGACVYVKSTTESEKIDVNLLCSKTRVAPLKLLTIPRLELCGALMLAILIDKVKSALTVNFDEIFLWTDSTICLNWIRTPPNTLQTFVANRVSQIQTLTSPIMWNHVNSKENPADMLSRGLNPEKIQSCQIWWKGPSFLLKPQSSWPKCKFHILKDLPEIKGKNIICHLAQSNKDPIFNQFSDINRLKRIIAYCSRFLSNCRSKSNRETGPLTTLELENAMKYLVKMSQSESFSLDIGNLKTGKRISKRLTSLCPFLDDDGIMRVGGRLRQSELNFNQKHPALLSANHKLTRLIFESEHRRLFHAGAQLLLYTIRMKYWPLGGRNLSKKTVRHCVRCFRVNPTTGYPLMGDLPKERVCPAPAFYTTGVDYAGPLLLKTKKGRGGSTIKSYICLFICFTTKAIHLELVNDLTKESFLAAFRRFTSRRGKPQTVYSDNGTNFVGANTELKELAKFLKDQHMNIQEIICNEGVNWRFIPAYSPHMGGIWEAGVKSCKAHLKRVLGNVKLTFEEMYTVLTEIEAILNSRPLNAMSSDPNDSSSLTPSHFLIGQPITALPEPSLKDIPCTRLSRYQLVQQLKQHFWARWAQEYVSELQVRTKWRINQPNVRCGQLVVIKDKNTPPLCWQLGRVIQVHPGLDGIVRVASVKTSVGTVIKRSCATLCELPLESPDTDIKP